MEKQFIPYEQALKLKELGFDEECFGYYNDNNIPVSGNYPCLGNNNAPLWQQAFDWFRSKKYQAEILWRGDFGDFCWKIGRFKQGSHFFSEDGFKTYKEAQLACLDKLIEIVEQQKQTS